MLTCLLFKQICSLLRGGIAERGGVRVGHRIIEINEQSVVAVPHERIVNLLATSVGEVRRIGLMINRISDIKIPTFSILDNHENHANSYVPATHRTRITCFHLKK